MTNTTDYTTNSEIGTEAVSLRGIVVTPPLTVSSEGRLLVTFFVAVPRDNRATEWFHVRAAGSLANNVRQSLRKGDRVLLSGICTTRAVQGSADGPAVEREFALQTAGHDLDWGVSSWLRTPRLIDHS